MHLSLKSALATLALAAGFAALAPTAHAQVTFTFSQVGSDVDAQASGTLNLNGLSYFGSGSGARDFVQGSAAVALVGTSGASYDTYSGVSGPGSFGSGGFFVGSGGSGSLFAISGSSGSAGRLDVPRNYTSGTAISGSAVFTNQTFSSLGLTPGTYTYKLPNDTVTVQIGAPAPAVPEPSTVASLGVGGLGLLGLVAARRRKATV